MALWSSFDIPYLENSVLELIHLSDMTSIIMQGIDSKNRPYLAMRVFYDGDQRIGFIIQKYAYKNDEWEYGVLESLDLYKMTKEECDNMNSRNYGGLIN
jgi:hypothetical protein